MKEFYVIVGGGGGIRKFFENLIFGRVCEYEDEAREKAKERVRKQKSPVFVLKAVGYAHIPEPKPIWRKTR